MRTNRLSRLRTVAVASTMAIGLVLGLSGCAFLPSDPGQPTGARLNKNGTIDWVSCDVVSNIANVRGETFRWTGPNGTENDKTKVELTELTPLPQTLAIGQKVRLAGLPPKWDRLYVDVGARSSSGKLDNYVVETPINRTDLTVGEWHWYFTNNCLNGTTN
jgi:hypothetical protein